MLSRHRHYSNVSIKDRQKIFMFISLLCDLHSIVTMKFIVAFLAVIAVGVSYLANFSKRQVTKFHKRFLFFSTVRQRYSTLG